MVVPIKNEFEKVENEFLQYLKSFIIQPKKLTFEAQIVDYKKIKLLNKEKKKQKIKSNNKRLLERKQLVDKRLNDIKMIGICYGMISELSFIWGVSHTQVRRYIKQNFGGIAQLGEHLSCAQMVADSSSATSINVLPP